MSVNWLCYSEFSNNNNNNIAKYNCYTDQNKCKMEINS